MSERYENSQIDQERSGLSQESVLKFVAALRAREVSSDSPAFRRHLAVLFESEGVNLQSLAYMTVRSLSCWRPFKELVDDAERSDVSGIAQKLERPEYREALDSPLIHRFLRRAIVNDLAAERLLVILRQILLRQVERDEQGLGSSKIRLMVTLACQCFNNEYIYPVTISEEETIKRLKEHIQKQIRFEGGDGLPEMLTAYAMYAPLWSLHLSDEIMGVPGLQENPEIGEVLRRQVCEYVEEEAIRKEIRSFGMSGEVVTHDVRRQYEESPYPRWLDVTLPSPVPFAEAMAERFPFLGPVEMNRPVRILIAGCGTGHHPIQVAARYSDAEVLAVDISKASLAYAIRQARRYGLSNLEFLHGDLLCVEKLGRQFDSIESVGVLHTLADPLSGFRALANVLGPGGFLKIGVYSRRARVHLEAAKGMIESRNMGRSPAELRAIRQEIIASQPQAERTPMDCGDFFCLSGFRDMLCPAHEVLYAPGELKEILGHVGLSFLGYRNLDAEMREVYRRRFPQDPAMRDLVLLDRFEAENPDLFWSLQNFWVRKN